MTRILSLLALAALGACATAGSTFRSGVGDRFLEHPPYYAGRALDLLQSPRIAAFPVEFQRGASQAEIFDPSSAIGTAVAALLADMNAVLDSVLPGARLAPATELGSVAPNTYFGCERDATNDCVARGDSVLGREQQTMRLAVERPSRTWIAGAAARLDSAQATHALVLTLEVGQYWPRQSGWKGDKSVELGTRHVVSLPWLTSLETPVSVLQLTGALVDRQGQAVKIGAEGILAARTGIIASGFGLQRLISPEDVAKARALRHEDRPGQPLVWRAALCELLVQLAGKTCG